MTPSRDIEYWEMRRTHVELQFLLNRLTPKVDNACNPSNRAHVYCPLGRQTAVITPYTAEKREIKISKNTAFLLLYPFFYILNLFM